MCAKSSAHRQVYVNTEAMRYRYTNQIQPPNIIAVSAINNEDKVWGVNFWMKFWELNGVTC